MTTTASASTAGRKSAGRKRQTTGESAPRTSGPKTTRAGTRTSSGRSRAKEPAAKEPAKKPTEEPETGKGLSVHMAHPSIPIPYVTGKDVSATMRTAGSALPSAKLPPADRLAFYGGLGALAVFGAVDWPVAAAIGVATAVARRGRHEKESEKASENE